MTNLYSSCALQEFNVWSLAFVDAFLSLFYYIWAIHWVMMDFYIFILYLLGVQWHFLKSFTLIYYETSSIWLTWHVLLFCLFRFQLFTTFNSYMFSLKIFRFLFFNRFNSIFYFFNLLPLTVNLYDLAKFLFIFILNFLYFLNVNNVLLRLLLSICVLTFELFYIELKSRILIILCDLFLNLRV